MTRWNHLFKIGLIIVALAVLAGCGDPYLSALQPQGPAAQEQLNLIYLSLAIMILVFIVVLAIYFYVLVRFRHRPEQTEYPKQVEGSHKLEVLWTVVPIILILILAVFSVISTFNLADETVLEDESVVIKVTAHQYWWEFEYPDYGIVISQELIMPKDEWVLFELEANDVIHSFWIPALGGKMDNVPGLNNRLMLKADKLGTFYGKCAELCGPSHALMDFKATVLEADEFSSWVERMQAYSNNPTTALALQGQEIYAQSCLQCHAIDPAQRSIYPNLSNFADRAYVGGWWLNTDVNLKAWILNAPDLKPGNMMPGFEGVLSDEQVNALIEYMRTLTVN
jgi:cytochrome c oxidase subunit 2